MPAANATHTVTLTPKLPNATPLDVVRLDGAEEISQLFEFRVQALSSGASVAATQLKSLIGQPVKISINRNGNSPRLIHGIVASISNHGFLPDTQRTLIEFTVVPEYWKLTLNRDCQVFTDLDARSIATRILEERRMPPGTWFGSDLELKARELCIQYLESDWDFVMRLLEDEGVYFLFEHGNETANLTFAKQHLATEHAVVWPATESDTDADRLIEWRRDYSLTAGNVTIKDYNPNNSTAALQFGRPNSAAERNGETFDQFEYPAGYRESADGESRVKYRLQEEELDQDVVRGISTYRQLSAGVVVNVPDHPQLDDEAGKFLLTRVEHHYCDPRFADPASGRLEYQNEFHGMPASQSFRPPRRTAKPRIDSVQSATVVHDQGVAKEDDPISVNDKGQVKVQFHWDRYHENNGSSSCWVRVSQVSAGNGWGSIFTPHVGQEVIISFLNGDPDRPVITGRLYNDQHLVPSEEIASEDKHKSIIRDHGGNNLVFDATPGSENVQIASDKDFGSFTVKDRHDVSLGDSSEITVGLSSSIGAGLSSELFLGMQSSVFAGASAELSLANSYGFSVGNEYSFRAGLGFSLEASRTIEHNQKEYEKRSDERISFDSNKDVLLRGGTNNAAIAKVAPDSVYLSYRDPQGTTPTVDDRTQFWINVGLLASGILGAGAGAMAGAAAAMGAVDGKTAKESSMEFNDVLKASRKESKTVGLGVAAAVAGLAALGFDIVALSGGAVDPEGAHNDKCSSSLSLDKLGAKLTAAREQGSSSGSTSTAEPAKTYVHAKNVPSGHLELRSQTKVDVYADGGDVGITSSENINLHVQQQVKVLSDVFMANQALEVKGMTPPPAPPPPPPGG